MWSEDWQGTKLGAEILSIGHLLINLTSFNLRRWKELNLDSKTLAQLANQRQTQDNRKEKLNLRCSLLSRHWSCRRLVVSQSQSPQEVLCSFVPICNRNQWFNNIQIEICWKRIYDADQSNYDYKIRHRLLSQQLPIKTTKQSAACMLEPGTALINHHSN